MALAHGPSTLPRAARRPIRIGWPLGVLAAVALIAVGAMSVAVFTRSPTAPSVRQARVGAPLYTADELAVMRSVARGFIPAETLEGGTFLLKRLVNQGLIPRATLERAQVPVLPLYSTEEHALMRLANQGLIPAGTLDSRVWLIKRLVNQGLIPRETLLRDG
jgi:hypothetical protein